MLTQTCNLASKELRKLSLEIIIVLCLLKGSRTIQCSSRALNKEIVVHDIIHIWHLYVPCPPFSLLQQEWADLLCEACSCLRITCKTWRDDLSYWTTTREPDCKYKSDQLPNLNYLNTNVNSWTFLNPCPRKQNIILLPCSINSN